MFSDLKTYVYKTKRLPGKIILMMAALKKWKWAILGYVGTFIIYLICFYAFVVL